MAIVIEEEKNNSNFAAAVGWVVIVVIILTAIYYIFFTTPPAAVTTPPSDLGSIAPITQINFNPETVMNDPGYRSLKEYIQEPSTSSIITGRINPFVAP